MVGLRNGIEPGVKGVAGFGCIENADRGRQQPVHGPQQIIDRDRVRNGERRNLSQGVDAGVSAAGACYVNGATLHAANDFLEYALDGRQTGLHLPAVEPGAVVGESDANAAQITSLNGS